MRQDTPRIMIVESLGSNMAALCGHLSGVPQSFEIVSAPDAPSALARLQAEEFDLVVVDSSLRGKVGGYDLCRALRSSSAHSQIPIILVLSGYLSLERFRGISAGADLLLHRPVVKEELFRMIHLLLRWKFDEGVNLRSPVSDGRAFRRLHSVS